MNAFFIYNSFALIHEIRGSFKCVVVKCCSIFMVKRDHIMYFNNRKQKLENLFIIQFIKPYANDIYHVLIALNNPVLFCNVYHVNAQICLCLFNLNVAVSTLVL